MVIPPNEWKNIKSNFPKELLDMQRDIEVLAKVNLTVVLPQ
jgi:hypothetical protein